MPRFYLHICDRGSKIEDDEGYEFANVDAAREEALESARELMASDLREGKPLRLDRSFVVSDDGGMDLFTVQFRDALASE